MTEPEQRHPRKTRWLARGLIVALIALAVWYLRCGGRGYGLGPGGIEPVGVPDEPTRPNALVSPDPRGSAAGDGAGAARRCQLRLDSGGLWMLGGAGQTQVDVAAAVASCQEAGGADVVVTGEATQGGWDELRAALDAAGVPSFVRGGGATTGTPAPEAAPVPGVPTP
jgi:hypothetical protein